MTSLKLVTLSLTLFAAPAIAESLTDTHDMRWAPAGKNPAVTYHPKRSCEPQAVPVHLAGKTQFVVPSVTASTCSSTVAKADRGPQDSAATN